MVEDVVHRVAVVDVAVKVSKDDGAAHEAVGAPRWAWWRIGESAIDEDGDASR